MGKKENKLVVSAGFGGEGMDGGGSVVEGVVGGEVLL